MAVTSFATTPTFYRLGEIIDGFSGVHIFGTGLTYGPNGGFDVPVTGTISSMKLFVDGVAVTLLRDLPVSDVAALSSVLPGLLATATSTDPSASYQAVFEAFEGATFVDLMGGGLEGSPLSDDVLHASATGTGLSGLGGDDMLVGGAGRDDIFGGDGNDDIFGGGDGDFIVGGDGNDMINSGSGNDTVFGLEGDNIVRLGAGNDLLQATQSGSSATGTTGDDVVFGGSGDDFIIMSEGNDRVFGGANNDTIYTGGGNDIVRGGEGEDLIAMGPGRNQLYGGDDSDTFFFIGVDLFDPAIAGPSRASHISTIRDFDVTEDVLGLSFGSFFGGNDALADFLSFMAQSVEVGDDIRFTDATTGQRVIIKDVGLDELDIANFIAVPDITLT